MNQSLYARVEYLKERIKLLQERRKPMPVRKSKGGYQYGTQGKVYRGKGAKGKAAKQGRAIQASKRRHK